MSNSNNLYEAPDLGKYVLVPSFKYIRCYILTHIRICSINGNFNHTLTYNMT